MGLLGALSFRDVHQHVDGADDAAGFIPQRRWIGGKPHPRAVGTLGDSFRTAYGPALLQGNGHGALIVRHGCAVGIIELPGHTPRVRPQFGDTPGKSSCCRIEVRDSPLGVSRVNGCRQRIRSSSGTAVRSREGLPRRACDR